MNVLFATNLKPNVTSGGIERTTVALASQMSERYRWSCFSVYASDDGSQPAPCFIGTACIGQRPIADSVRRWGVDVIVVQSASPLSWAPNLSGLPESTKVVFAYHCDPGWEARWPGNSTAERLRDLRYAVGLEDRIKCLLRLVGGRAFDALRYGRATSGRVRAAYEASDATVLLSEGYRENFMSLSGEADGSKLSAIPNMLSYDRFATHAEITSKEKTVLLVARLQERPKRVSLALDVWKSIKSDPRSSGWKLDIVGHGPNLLAYERKVIREQIPDVRFLGRKEPLEDYLRSSFFLMTSISEGWPMTLMEAMQTGCVPVVFDSFAAARDIVDDGEAGLLFAYGDVTSMADGILTLMEDDERRMGIASAAVESSGRFLPALVARRWKKLLEELTCGSL